MMNWDGTKGLAQIAERCYRSDMKHGLNPAAIKALKMLHDPSTEGSMTLATVKKLTESGHLSGGSWSSNRGIDDVDPGTLTPKGHAALGEHYLEKGDKDKAAEHAAAAGSEWDEEKHPRDENGKFA